MIKSTQFLDKDSFHLFGKKLHEARVVQGLSLNEIAQKTGVSLDALEHWDVGIFETTDSFDIQGLLLVVGLLKGRLIFDFLIADEENK